MNKDFRKVLEEELEKAQEEFRQAKAEAIKNIDSLDAVRAEDFGAGYVSHIDKISIAAAKVKEIGYLLGVYDHCSGK